MNTSNVIDSHSDRQASRHTDRQTGRHTDRQEADLSRIIQLEGEGDHDGSVQTHWFVVSNETEQLLILALNVR